MKRCTESFKGGPDKGKIHPIWDSSGAWGTAGGGSSELGLVQSTEIPNVGPEAWSVTPGAGVLCGRTQGRRQSVQGPTVGWVVKSEGEGVR